MPSPRPFLWPSAAAALIIVALARDAGAATFTVQRVDDAGPGSLRQAILDANATPGWDAIDFAIPGPAGAVQTITPLTPLPFIAERVTIDGSTQGLAGEYLIALDGSALGWSDRGLRVGGNGSIVHHLVLHGFGYGLELFGQEVEVLDCRIGTDATGQVEMGNVVGIRMNGARQRIVGNLISGNLNDGLFVLGGFHTIESNLIGPDRDGLPFAGTGINQLNALKVASSGTSVRGNVIAAAQTGIQMLDSSENVIAGNLIGLAPDLRTPLGVGTFGIHLMGFSDRNVIGGDKGNQANVIAHVGGGLWGTGAAIRHEAGWADGIDNVYRGNQLQDLVGAALGIDLGALGPDANDPLDADSGPNELQNGPVIVDAQQTIRGTIISGELSSAPLEVYTIDVYSDLRVNGACEARAHVGSVVVRTRSNGRARFTLTTVLASVGELVSATATQGEAGVGLGSTSELSPCVTGH
jgi:hypothetical protein